MLTELRQIHKWRPEFKAVIFFAVTTEFGSEFQIGIIRSEIKLCLTTYLNISEFTSVFESVMSRIRYAEKLGMQRN